MCVSTSNNFLFVSVRMSYSLLSAKRTHGIKAGGLAIWKVGSDKSRSGETGPLGDSSHPVQQNRLSQSRP